MKHLDIIRTSDLLLCNLCSLVAHIDARYFSLAEYKRYDAVQIGMVPARTLMTKAKERYNLKRKAFTHYTTDKNIKE